MTTATDLQTLELLEAKALQHIFSRSLGHRIALKGGLALRATHGSPRMTDDIDLNAVQSMSDTALDKTIGKALASATAELQSLGLIHEPTVNVAKQTDTTWRWKVNAELERGGHLHMQVEVSRRAAELGTPISRTTRPITHGHVHVPSTMIDVYPPDQLATAKLVALLARDRNKPRDLYDLQILINAQVQPSAELADFLADRQAKTGESVDDTVNRLWQNIEAIDYEIARTQLLDHLDTPVANNLTEQHWVDIQTEVGDTVAQWLRDAHERVPDNGDTEDPDAPARPGP